MKLNAILSASCGLVMFALPAAAHHSFSMFDNGKTVTLTGVVKQLEWTNPHSWLYVVVADEAGKPSEYALEMQGTGQAQKNGWNKESVKPGDRLTFVMHPLKSGSRGGMLLNVTMDDGRKLSAVGRAPSAVTGE